MSDKTRNIIIAVIAALVILWFIFRKNPQVAGVIQNVTDGLSDLLPVQNISLVLPDSNIGSYVPAQMPGIDMSTRRGSTPCNFCLQSRTNVTTPSPVIQIPNQQAAVPAGLIYGKGGMGGGF